MKLTSKDKSGPLSWMARNGVAPNLLMVFLLLGGALAGLRLKQEVFPEFQLDFCMVSVPYPGASPEEIEQGILLAVEEGIRGIDGVDKITAVASENKSTIAVELMTDIDSNKVVADIKNAVDRITSFPEDAERPQVYLLTSRNEVMSILLSGDQPEKILRKLAEKLRDRLLLEKEITQVDLAGVRPLEIGVEIPQAKLRRYGLTLEQVAREVSRAAVEVPGGRIKTERGEVLLRMSERRDLAREFEDIRLLATRDGSEVRLGDFASIEDGFQDTDKEAFYNGKPAVMIKVFRIGDQTPIQIADASIRALNDFQPSLPPGITAAVWKDDSQVFRARVDLLMRNAALGLVLVLFILGLFLEIRLAFWVTLGIPISFLGSMLFLPILNVSINMISLFAYIVTLGMVVDDAIVVGENIFEERQKGTPFMKAAITGVREVVVPVTFSILTTIAAFMPMFFLPGFTGKIFRVIPAIVVSVLVISLIESVFVLPAHLGHGQRGDKTGVWGWIDRGQSHFSKGLVWFVNNSYRPFLEKALHQRYLTVAIGLTTLILTFGYIAGGRMTFSFLPDIESDKASANLTLPFGVAIDKSRALQARLVREAQAVIEELGGKKYTKGIYTEIGSHIGNRHRSSPTKSNDGSHLASVQVSLVSAGQRPFTAFTFLERWRQRVGEVAGVENLTFNASSGPSAGAPIDIQLSHRKVAALEKAGADLAGTLAKFSGVKEIDDGFADGKPQLDFKLRPLARSLGLSAVDIGRQVRGAFLGIEALRQQRGRDEVRVMVRYPEAERRSEYNIESLILRSPQGGEVLLSEAADIERGSSYTQITRVDGRRTINVTAEVDAEVTSGDKVQRALLDGPIKDLLSRHSGLGFSMEGENRQRAEAMEVLAYGMILALFVIYGLLAIPFGSYSQPLIIMSAIPFGIVGAVFGHVIMGFGLSVISMMGIVALTGVVVNDSLVLLDAANRRRREGATHHQAIVEAGQRRFRPILLTSLTTFFGLVPMILETSLQARFLIPMAISLGFGVLFATFIILLIVPALYLILEDLRWAFFKPADEQ